MEVVPIFCLSGNYRCFYETSSSKITQKKQNLLHSFVILVEICDYEYDKSKIRIGEI